VGNFIAKKLKTTAFFWNMLNWVRRWYDKERLLHLASRTMIILSPVSDET
jgi:hypothetical protein